MKLPDLFPQFDQALVDELLRIGRIVEFNDDEILMRTGQYFKYSLLILEGTVKLYRQGQQGEEFFLYHLSGGSACALSMICAARNETSEIQARAVTPVKALAIPLAHMDNLMKNHRNWYYFVLETYRSRFEELLQVVDQIAFHALDEKLEFYLKRQFESLGGDTLSVTHQEIANDLNSSREVITRLLKKLEAQQKISLSRHAITNRKL
ncbi:MAG: Crp/Fnr family transcriptional regulator [Ferruginibacter sp.]|nr:Crp/Fnr family transcriptional regulator [Cytophagales bacterium]